MIAKNTL